jgi:hypothetical protein
MGKSWLLCAGDIQQHLGEQLANEAEITDAAAREEVQHSAFHDGNLIQQVGALLLELGRTTLSLRMGQSPVSLLRLWVKHIQTESGIADVSGIV